MHFKKIFELKLSLPYPFAQAVKLVSRATKNGRVPRDGLFTCRFLHMIMKESLLKIILSKI